MDALLTPKEVAQRIGVHPQTAWRYMTTGKMPARKLEGRWVVKQSELEAWIR